VKVLFTMLTDITGVVAMVVMLQAIMYKAFRDKFEKSIVLAIMVLLFLATIGALGEMYLS
jgi:hypothetical protein